ncbi:MAG TPA: hypothetical protein DEA08_13225 [Planctomycetes bacterium]|nr:hypothetical protein [Planctomycetota bacterium]
MRKAWAVSVGVFLMIALFTVAFPLIVLGGFSHTWRINVSRIYSRIWSRGVLWACGIKLVVTGKENLGHLPAIYLFNHANQLDFFVNACYAPRNCLVFGKRELARVPFLGWIWLLGGHPMIRRQKLEHGLSVWDDVIEKLQAGTHCTIVAPEGTRSRHGKLLPFKKGPFVSAIRSGAPLVPVVIKGGVDRLAKGGRLVPGTIEVEVHPPIPTKDWSKDSLEQHMAEVRQLYLRYFEPSEPAEAKSA